MVKPGFEGASPAGVQSAAPTGQELKMAGRRACRGATRPRRRSPSSRVVELSDVRVESCSLFDQSDLSVQRRIRRSRRARGGHVSSCAVGMSVGPHAALYGAPPRAHRQHRQRLIPFGSPPNADRRWGGIAAAFETPCESTRGRTNAGAACSQAEHRKDAAGALGCPRRRTSTRNTNEAGQRPTTTPRIHHRMRRIGQFLRALGSAC